MQNRSIFARCIKSNFIFMFYDDIKFFSWKLYFVTFKNNMQMQTLIALYSLSVPSFSWWVWKRLKIIRQIYLFAETKALKWAVEKLVIISKLISKLLGSVHLGSIGLFLLLSLFDILPYVLWFVYHDICGFLIHIISDRIAFSIKCVRLLKMCKIKE